MIITSSIPVHAFDSNYYTVFNIAASIPSILLHEISCLRRRIFTVGYYLRSANNLLLAIRRTASTIRASLSTNRYPPSAYRRHHLYFSDSQVPLLLCPLAMLSLLCREGRQGWARLLDLRSQIVENRCAKTFCLLMLMMRRLQIC